MINEKLTVKWYYINVNERNKVLHTEMLFSDIFLSRLWPGRTLTDITMCKRHQGSTRQRESVSQRAGCRQPLAARSETEFTWSPQWSAPVKKFGRVRLSTIFITRTMSLCSVLSFTASKQQEKVFKNTFNGIFGHQEAWCMNSSFTLIVIRHLGKFSCL